MIVVSNTSPLTNLAAINQFHLLQLLYGQIHIAEGVWLELNAYGQAWPGSQETGTATWINRYDVKNRQLVLALQRDLDRGEAESIALALELNAELILLDEKDGRSTAKRLGCKPVGVIGILLSAKKQSYINAIKPHLDALRQQAGFFLANTLYEQVLILAEEN